MNSTLEKIVIQLLSQLITSELIKGKEKELIGWLRTKAQESSTTALDNWAVELLAVALGVS